MPPKAETDRELKTGLERKDEFNNLNVVFLIFHEGRDVDVNGNYRY